MNGITRALLAGPLLCGLAACGSSTAPDLTGSKAQSFCGGQSWIAGVTELCDGRLVYRDYVYDDYGADLGSRTTPISKGTLSPSAGDARYPAGAENTADLVRLELALAGNRVEVEFELNTLYQADQTLAAIALDTDNNASTGGGAWDGLGIRSQGWDVLYRFAQGDPATNLIRGSFPRPAGSSWTIWAVVAQADGTVMNVAFRGSEEQAGANASPNAVNPAKGDFWEDQQAAALADGDITAFAASVQVSDLRAHVSRAAQVPPGLHQRVYTSAYTLPPGEGVSPAGVPGRHGDTGNTCEQYFHYLGKYQPYGIYIPNKPGPHGVQFALHGCAANHASLINQPGMQRRFGEDLNRIILVPLGRGPVGWYSDISERDVLDVLDDVRANYAVDADQIISGGYSMGGYGTLRFAALYPHLFAAATNWVGFTGDVTNAPGGAVEPQGAAAGGLGNVIDFLGNLRHVPIVNLYAAADELVQVHTGLAMQERLASVPVVHEFYMHADAEHLTFAILDDWAKEAAFSAGRKRVHNPAHVTYRTDASLAFPEYNIRHDRAYWLSDIRARAEGYADLDVVSYGCGPVNESELSVAHDVGFGPAPLVWERQFTQPSLNMTLVLAPLGGFQARLANVASVHVDAAAACLAAQTQPYHVETDGPVEIRFSDGRVLSFAGAGEYAGVF